MVTQYGGKLKALPLDHIYLLKPDSVLAMTEGKLAGGIHKPLGVKIGVERGKSNLLFASTVWPTPEREKEALFSRFS